MTDPFLAAYVKSIESNLKSGTATEHTHRPALVALLEKIAPDHNIINEAKHIECGAPDVTLLTAKQLVRGYVETKDISVSLSEAEGSPQLRRYRSALRNLVLTDYIEFRWYVDGSLKMSAALGGVDAKKIKVDTEGAAQVLGLLREFISHSPEPIANPEDLARRMAKLAHLIRDVVIEAFRKDHVSKEIQDLRKAFAEALIPDMGDAARTPDFADMFAQTIVYGFFAARVNHDGGVPFVRYGAAHMIPKTNPLLRRIFEIVTGSDFDDEPYISFVEDLVSILAVADIPAILEHFGNRNKQQDPVIHFYETFLAEYDPEVRERRGVFFTPEPVVSYIVRSVDSLLQKTFGIAKGLSDDSKVSYTKTLLAVDPASSTMAMKPTDVQATSHKVLVLDPACGTGTFLYSIVDIIRGRFIEGGNAGMWSGYVKEHLLPRLFGFEILMAPYAVSHFALSLQLAGKDLPAHIRKQWAYDFSSEERLKVYLTNTLEPARSVWSEFFGALRILTEEAQAASNVKSELPIMVVVGNPPYSGQSANRSWMVVKGKRTQTFIGRLLDEYYQVDGKGLGEKNPRWLQDDYVKFLRWGQWRIERSGQGIMAFITNHGYLDNPTFRGMRQKLMDSFDEIYILDLHGNTKKKERTPNGSKDENVFEIQQGVSIGIFIRHRERLVAPKVSHADLWGLRDEKYAYLLTEDVLTTSWEALAPAAPDYLFKPQDAGIAAEFRGGWAVPRIFPLNSVGIATARDALTIRWTADDVVEVIEKFTALDEAEAREKFHLGSDAQDWKVKLAQQDLVDSGLARELVVPIHYRPFDTRFTYYTGKSRGFHCRPRPEVMRQMINGDNVGLITSRLTKGESFTHVDATRNISEVICLSPRTSNNGFLFPLYRYPDPKKQDEGQEQVPGGGSWPAGKGGRRPNLDAELVNLIEKHLGMRFVLEGTGDLTATFGPLDVLHYVLAVLHSPSYRARYTEPLSREFPRIQFTSDKALFVKACRVGSELLGCRVLDPGFGAHTKIQFPVKGSDRVEKRFPQFVAPGETPPGAAKPLTKGRTYINAGQYFEGASQAAWLFVTGGYRPAQKWLADRQERLLSYDDLKHYGQMVGAIVEIARLSADIDGIFPKWPLDGAIPAPP